MPASTRDDELPTLDLTDLSKVTGGTGDDMSSMLPIMLMMMMRNQSQAAAAPPAAIPPWQPTITVDGVPQQLTPGANGALSASTTV
ncbi:MAG TPA: hypothetical protein VK601_15265 [Kofleriaceae bacterium]|nr:hypothetical protein [Kofleriaceae bacterium]